MKIKIPQPSQRLRDFDVVGSMYRQPRVKAKKVYVDEKIERTRRG